MGQRLREVDACGFRAGPGLESCGCQAQSFRPEMTLFSKLFGGEAPVHPPLPAGVDRFLPAGEPSVFRATATARAPHPSSGVLQFRSGAGSSTVSQADAEREAEERAQRHLDAALADGGAARDSYAYAVDRGMEPVVEVLALPQGSDVARVTINSYGALIVNARSALFVDVDTRREEDKEEDAGASDLAAARLRDVVTADPALGFRVYRTRNGWRYLCTTRTFDPASDETRGLLEQLGADAKYVLLCRAQRCFRARLTPKPWRIGCRFFNVHPTEAIARQRVERYLKKAAPYATAAFTARVGSSHAPPPELQLILDHHDSWCAAESGRPLA